LTYSKPKIQFDFLAQAVGANFNPEVGYVPRTRFSRFAPDFFYACIPSRGSSTTTVRAPTWILSAMTFMALRTPITICVQYQFSEYSAVFHTYPARLRLGLLSVRSHLPGV